MINQKRLLADTLKQAIESHTGESLVVGFLGDGEGNVRTDQRGYVNVILFNGQRIVARNTAVPPVPWLPVLVGATQNNPHQLQVLRSLNVYTETPYPEIMDHWETHQWPEYDTLWVRQEQILHGIPIPIPNSLTIRWESSGLVRTKGQLRNLNHLEVDFTAEIPASGAEWVAVELDENNAVSFNHGENVAAVGLLDYSNLPSITPGHALLFVAKTYASQTSFQKNLVQMDVLDLRFTRLYEYGEMLYRGAWSGTATYQPGHLVKHTGVLYLCEEVTTNDEPPDTDFWFALGGGGGGGTPGGSDTQVQFNDDGAFGGDAGFRYDAVNGVVKIGNTQFNITAAGALSQGSDQNSVAHFMETLGTEIASYITGIRGRGEIGAPEPVQAGDVLFRMRGRAYDDTGLGQTSAEVRLVAAETHSSTAHGANVEIHATANGSTTLEKIATIDEEGINVESGKTFRIDGVPIGGREILSANRTYYVRTDGSDSNTGLVNNSGGAFLTIQKAVDTAAALDTSIYDVTIQLGSGTRTETVTLKNAVGSGVIIIQGDVATPANVVSRSFIKSGPGTTYRIKDMQFTGSSTNSAITATNGALVEHGNNIYGSGYTYHLQSTFGGIISCISDYTITSGPSFAHITVRGNAQHLLQGKTVTLSGTPAFGTTGTAGFLECRYAAVIFINGNTFSGSATGRRYYVDLNAVAQSAVATLPGNVAGVTATGGVYA